MALIFRLQVHFYFKVGLTSKVRTQFLFTCWYLFHFPVEFFFFFPMNTCILCHLNWTSRTNVVFERNLSLNIYVHFVLCQSHQFKYLWILCRQIFIQHLMALDVLGEVTETLPSRKFYSIFSFFPNVARIDIGKNKMCRTCLLWKGFVQLEISI